MCSLSVLHCFKITVLGCGEFYSLCLSAILAVFVLIVGLTLLGGRRFGLFLDYCQLGSNCFLWWNFTHNLCYWGSYREALWCILSMRFVLMYKVIMLFWLHWLFCLLCIITYNGYFCTSKFTILQWDLKCEPLELGFNKQCVSFPKAAFKLLTLKPSKPLFHLSNSMTGNIP